MSEQDKKELLHNMLVFSQSVNLIDIDERLLNMWGIVRDKCKEFK